MSEIQVNTSDLHNGSQNLNSAAHELGEVQNQLGHISASVGDAYEGQLRDALEEIMGGAIHTGGRLQIRAHELGNELTTRANGFEAANEVGRSAVLGVSTEYIKFTQRIPILGYLSFLRKVIFIGLPFWNMSGLIIGGLAIYIHHSFRKPTDTQINETQISNTKIDKEPASTSTKRVENSRGIVEVPVNENADPSDCVKFVKGQKVDWPGNVTNMKGWAGGTRDENYNYGDEPKPGAIMVEAKSDDPKIGATYDGVDYGHVSYIKSVEYDNKGKIIKFTVVEGNWGSTTKMHERVIDWPSSKYQPEVFIYGKK